MRVKFKITYAGKETFEAGKVYDIDEAMAISLLNLGDVEPVEYDKTNSKTANKKL